MSMPDPKPPNSDSPIVDEVRRVREELSAKTGHDIGRYFEDLLRAQDEAKKQGARFVRLPSAKHVRRPTGSSS